MYLQKAVAMRIVALLNKNNNMTEYELSQKSGLTRQAISNIMNEKYKSVKFDTIIKLADGFGMTLVEFIDDDLFKRENLDIE